MDWTDKKEDVHRWLVDRGWEMTDPRGLYSKTFIGGPIALRENLDRALMFQIKADNQGIG